MLTFPQLITGASALYPLRKTRSTRTVVNELDDGQTHIYVDPNAAFTLWELEGRGLTNSEWESIETLFVQTSGMWGTFTFLDPVGNLLVQSEHLSAAAWVKSAAIQLNAGVTDPLSTSRATRIINSGQGIGQIQQVLNVPGHYHYCFSAWLRTTSESGVTASIAAGAVQVTRVLSLTTDWQRLFVSGNPGQSASVTVQFQLELTAGASLEIFGLQAEAQLAPSDYKVTANRGGVYSRARFAADQISVRTQGTDIQDTVIRIISMES
jgi:hypothetical protein